MIDSDKIKEIVIYFKNNYHGKTINIETSGNNTINIPLHINHLPHLLGLHKLYRMSAKNIIDQVIKGKITYKIIKSHDDFGLIKDRIKFFPVLDEIIKNDEVEQYIIVSEYDNRNRMKLDIVFQMNKYHRYLILGVRKKEGSFYLTTFFVSRKEQYLHSKRHQITKIYITESLGQKDLRI